MRCFLFNLENFVDNKNPSQKGIICDLFKAIINDFFSDCYSFAFLEHKKILKNLQSIITSKKDVIANQIRLIKVKDQSRDLKEAATIQNQIDQGLKSLAEIFCERISNRKTGNLTLQIFFKGEWQQADKDICVKEIDTIINPFDIKKLQQIKFSNNSSMKFATEQKDEEGERNDSCFINNMNSEFILNMTHDDLDNHASFCVCHPQKFSTRNHISQDSRLHIFYIFYFLLLFNYFFERIFQ